MKRIVFLTTELVDLVLVTPEDAETIAPWFNDQETTSYIARGEWPMTTAFEREYLEKMYTDKAQLMLGIWHKKDKKLIGVVGLHNINYINQTATFGITIGEKEYWGKKVGTEVLTVILKHAFGRLNLRSVKLNVLSNNPRGQRCYEKCGFTQIGRHTNHIFKDGEWHDEILMIANNPLYT